MERTKNISSILLSIFNRKGGEGVLTKILTDENKANYANQLILLEEDENALLIYREDDFNWLLLTNIRILEEREGVKNSIFLSELKDVNIAFKEEFNDKVVNKEEFTRLLLEDEKGNCFFIIVEKGKPFQGLYQVLHHISSNNKTSI